MCASQGPECLPARQSAQGQGDGGREEGGVASSLVRNVNGSRQLHSEHTPRQPTAMAMPMDSSASAVTVSLTRGLPNDATRRHGTGTRPRRPTPRRVHSPPTTPTAAAAAAANTRARDAKQNNTGGVRAAFHTLDPTRWADGGVGCTPASQADRASVRSSGVAVAAPAPGPAVCGGQACRPLFPRRGRAHAAHVRRTLPAARCPLRGRVPVRARGRGRGRQALSAQQAKPSRALERCAAALLLVADAAAGRPVGPRPRPPPPPAAPVLPT